MNEGNSGTGYLRVRVTEAGGTLPVAGASVRITEYRPENEAAEGGILYALRTDRNGQTPALPLPAPSAEESRTPGAVQPYAVYNLFVTYGGYYPVEGVGVPVFDRITAVQPVHLLPLSEEDRLAGADCGRVMIYEIPDSESLQPGGVRRGREDIGSRNGTVTGGVINE